MGRSYRAHILVVDDDPQIRDFVSITLRAAGYLVSVAASGGEALNSVLSEAPDLVLTDIFMPDSDGFELLNNLRNSSVKVPVIAMSGDANWRGIDNLHLALRLGARLALQKPLQPSTILYAVKDLLGGHGIAAEVRPDPDSDLIKTEFFTG